MVGRASRGGRELLAQYKKMLQEIIMRCFKAVLSTKHEIKLDPAEIDAVMAGAAQGKLIRVKQGLINPSYLVAIIEDEERRISFLDDTKYDDKKRSVGMKSLKDVFADAPKQLKV